MFSKFTCITYKEFPRTCIEKRRINTRHRGERGMSKPTMK
uniref:Uncharacterized protein n=1 Tax=Arundo donax TaxID=35708 RepID=A0A0A9AXS4_ARUDO